VSEDGAQGKLERSAHHLQIGVAQPAGPDPDEDVAGSKGPQFDAIDDEGVETACRTAA
jgi:hypothetical protein